MKRLSIVLAVLLALVLLLAAAWQLALRELRSQVLAALGPRASIASIEIGWRSVQVHGLRLRGEAGRWPADDELRARRVALQPDLATVLGALLGREAVRIDRIEVDDAYLSVLLTREGKLRLVPGLLERAVATTAGSTRPVAPALRIDRIVLRGEVDFFDAAVRRVPHRLQLAALELQAGPLVVPALDQAVELKLQGLLRGARPGRDGRLAIDGRLTPATRDGRVVASARQVDLLVLAPYLVRAGDVAVTAGTLDLTLAADVQAQQLRAPGSVVLTGLELGSAGPFGMSGTFAGVPAGVVLAAIERDGRIEVPFTLQGRIDDPAFSVNGDFTARLALGLAEKLGVSVGGVVEGVAEGLKGLFRKR